MDVCNQDVGPTTFVKLSLSCDLPASFASHCHPLPWLHGRVKGSLELLPFLVYNNKDQMINERLVHSGVWGQDYLLPLMLSFEEHQSLQNAEQNHNPTSLGCLKCDLMHLVPGDVRGQISPFYFSWRNSETWRFHFHLWHCLYYALTHRCRCLMGWKWMSVRKPSLYPASPTLSQLPEKWCASSHSAFISAFTVFLTTNMRSNKHIKWLIKKRRIANTF